MVSGRQKLLWQNVLVIVKTSQCKFIIIIE